MTIQSFNSSRLKFARTYNRLTIKRLSELVGISSRMMTKYESDCAEPSTDSVSRLSEVLNFPNTFFYRDDVPDLAIEGISFRSLARMGAKERGRAICTGQLAIELHEWLAQRFNLPTPCIPNYEGVTPAAAADMLRNEWGLGNKSVSNMIHLLEAKGVGVFATPQDDSAIDAFCCVYNQKPYVFLNEGNTAARNRFNAAHELGHLVLHQHGSPTGKEREQEANAFALAFLMPEASVRSFSVSYPKVEHLIHLKRHWKVSAAALLKRLKDLDMVTEWSYRSLNIALAQRGYLNQDEPDDIAYEYSQIQDKVLKALWRRKITKQTIADELDVSLEDIEALLISPTRRVEMASNAGASYALSGL